MPPKRRAEWDTAHHSEPHSKRPRTVQPVKPRIIYKNHPNSGVGQDFHSVPYPLSLLPKKTWEALNQGASEDAVCSKCGKERSSTPHQRKLFLVAERLTWETGLTSSRAREENEIALWSVNAEFNIFDPIVDNDTEPGGKMSRSNPWFPFAGEEEGKLALRIVQNAEILSEASWKLWRQVAEAALRPLVEQENQDQGTADASVDFSSDAEGPLTSRSAMKQISPNSPLRRSPRKKGKSVGSTLPTPPSSGDIRPVNTISETEASRKCSYETLQDFYILLDKIERTSPVGAKFLEAYAERLHAELCRDCWFSEIIVNEPLDDEPRPPGFSSQSIPQPPRYPIPQQPLPRTVVAPQRVHPPMPYVAQTHSYAPPPPQFGYPGPPVQHPPYLAGPAPAIRGPQAGAYQGPYSTPNPYTYAPQPQYGVLMPQGIPSHVPPASQPAYGAGYQPGYQQAPPVFVPSRTQVPQRKRYARR